MAIDIKFSKFDNTPWGFRLTGGSEYGFPMTVVRVYEGSLSESFGLREGDILVALNEQGLVGASHESVHDCLTRAGNNFIATVLRGTYEMDDLQIFTAKIEKQPLIPSSCLSQESINNYNNTLTTTPTPLHNGTFVNKVPSDQQTSSSPCPLSSQPVASSPTSLFKPVAKTYKPFIKDINTNLPPLEKPSFTNSPAVSTIIEFQTIRQKEFLETAKKLVPDICKYVDKKNIGRSTPTFVLENLKNNSVETITASETETVSKFQVNVKEFKSVKPPIVNGTHMNGSSHEDNEKLHDSVEKPDEIKTVTSTFATNGKESEIMKTEEKCEIIKTEEKSEVTKTEEKSEVIKTEEKSEIPKEVTDTSVVNGIIKEEITVENQRDESIVKTTVLCTDKSAKQVKNIAVTNEITVSDNCLLDINEIEKSANFDDIKRNEQIIDIVKEYDEDTTECSTNEVRKSVKRMVEDYNRVTTPSPSLYKMSCRIRNPCVTPVVQEPVNVIEEIKIIKEEIIQYSPVPRSFETKSEKSEKVKTQVNPKTLTKKVHELSTSGMSLEEAKVKAIDAATVLSHEAKQRNYKIPCVSAHIPAQNQTDILLKTFFIHLTDVMVALTGMITNDECCHCGRVISKCTHKSEDIRETSQTVSNLVKEISERVSSSKMVNESDRVSEKTIDRTVIQKPPEKKIIQKSEAVQTDALKEVFQSTNKLGVDVTVNGKDPLLWLADLDDNKIIKIEESKKTETVRESAKVEESVKIENIVTSETIQETVSKSKVEEDRKKAEVIQEAMSTVESITSLAVENMLNRTFEESVRVEERKQSIKETVETEITDVKEEKAIIVNKVGENEYSVSLSRPKPQETTKDAEIEFKLEKKEEVEEVESVTIVELEKQAVEESSLHVEETNFMKAEVQKVEYTEEIVTEPIVKKKKPKKKKMMKVVAKDPLTPNTDEFFFRLDVKLEGLRSKTPEPPKEHEDFSIVRKSDETKIDQDENLQDAQTISEKKSSLKLDLRNKPDEVFVLVCQPSSEDSSPSGEITTKKTTLSVNKETNGALTSESVDIKTLKHETENMQMLEATAEKTNAFTSITNVCSPNDVQSIASDLPANLKVVPCSNNISSIESNVPKETGGTLVVGNVVNIEEQTSQASAHASSFIQTNDDSSKLATDSNSASLQTKESQLIQNGQSDFITAETKTTSVLNDVKMSTIEMCEGKEQYMQKDTSTTLCKESNETQAIKKLAYETTRKMSGEEIIKTEVDACKQTMNGTSTFIQNGAAQMDSNILNSVSTLIDKKDEVNGYQSELTKEIKSSVEDTVFEESVAQVKVKEANIGYASVETSRITNGSNQQSISSEASHMSRPGDNNQVDNSMVPLVGFLRDSEVFKVLNEESIKTRKEMLEEQRKQTKFLQKPNRPIPFCKRLAEQQSKEEAYKIDIRSQKKRESLDYGSSILTEGVFLIPEVPILVPEPPPELYVAPEYLADSAFPDLEDTGIPLPQKKTETPKPDETAEEPIQEEEIQQEVTEESQLEITEVEEEMKPTEGEQWKELVVDETIDESLPVEEQLLKVQKQLEALSRLPAAIQHTLDIVTKQLVNMVPRGDTPAPTVEPATEEETVKENGTCEINSEENVEQKDRASTEQCSEVTEITESVIHNGTNGDDSRASSRNGDGRKSVQFEEKINIREISNYTANSCEMSMETNCQKMNKDVTDQLSMDHTSRQLKQRPTPQTGGPSQKTTKQPAFGPLTPDPSRPLVLPGGRKWRGPKDAFTDSFIAETLSSQATVIQGKALGVDFLKYNKPPISLDHLKDSPVYKLIHEIEDEPTSPVLQGVANRTKVISETEYRERCPSVTPSHMEGGES